MKVGWKHSLGWSDREIDISEVLEDLQGSVIHVPRVIESGLDPVHSTGMVLITDHGEGRNGRGLYNVV